MAATKAGDDALGFTTQVEDDVEASKEVSNPPHRRRAGQDGHGH